MVAVEAAVRELLASAELQRHLHPEPAAKPGFARRAASAACRAAVSLAKGVWSRVCTLICRCGTKATEAASAVREGRVAIAERVRRGMMALGRQVWLGWFIAAGMARRFRKPLIVAAGVGAALAVACYLAGPAVSSLVNGVVGFAGALAAGMLARLRPLLRRLADREWDVGRAP